MRRRLDQSKARALAPAGAMEECDGLTAFIGSRGLSDRALAKVWATATGGSLTQATINTKMGSYYKKGS